MAEDSDNETSQTIISDTDTDDEEDVWGYNEGENFTPESALTVAVTYRNPCDKSPSGNICLWEIEGSQYVTFYHHRDERVHVFGVVRLSDIIWLLCTSQTCRSILKLTTNLNQEANNDFFWKNEEQTFSIDCTDEEDAESYEYGCIYSRLQDPIYLRDVETALDCDIGYNPSSQELLFFCDAWSGDPSPKPGIVFKMKWLIDEANTGREHPFREYLPDIYTVRMREILLGLDYLLHCTAGIVMEYI